MSRATNGPPTRQLPVAHNSGRHLLDGTLWVMLAEALFPITAVVTAGVLTRKLSPEEYGRLNLSVTFAGWSVGILLALFGRAMVLVVRRAVDWQGAAATIFWRQLAAAMLVLVGVLLSADLIADAWQVSGLATELRLMAFEIPLASSALALRQILVATGRFRQRALGGAVRWLVRMFLVVLLVELGFGVRGAIVGLVLTSAVDLGLGWFLAAIPFWGTSHVGWREFAGLAMPMFLTAISLRTFERIDLFALQTLGADAAQTALYGAAQNLALTPVWLAQSLLSLSLSSVAQLVIAGDLSGGRRLARQTLRFSVLLVPLAALVAGSAPQVISLVYGSRYTAASPVFVMLIFAAVGLVQVSVFAALLSAFDRLVWQAALIVPLIPLSVVAHGVAIPRLGSTGAALTTLGLTWSCVLVSGCMLYRLTSVAVPVGTLLRSAVLSAGGYFLAQHWILNGAWILLQLPALAVFSGVILIILGEFQSDGLTLSAIWHSSSLSCRRKPKILP